MRWFRRLIRSLWARISGPRQAQSRQRREVQVNQMLEELQRGGSYQSLDFHDSGIQQLPNGISIRFRLNLENCAKLTKLPGNLRAGTLILRGCTSLAALPEGLDVSFLDISGCRQLETWPRTGNLEAGRLAMRDCTGFASLPTWLGRISQLDLAGCVGLKQLPEGLEVSSWIDLADTGITRLPESVQGVGLRWRGVMIDERIAFRPSEITAQEVLAEKNAELRRVKMERMGYDRFLEDADPEILDIDTDAGGERKLLRVELESDEPLVCVSVICPSTGHRFLLRVPPTTTTCRQGIAWTAGFDDPNDYAPLIET